MNIGAFILTIDDGREHLQLRDQEGWSSIIRGGMTIVMSMIVIVRIYHPIDVAMCLVSCSYSWYTVHPRPTFYV